MVTGLATHKFTTFKSPSRLVCKSWGGQKFQVCFRTRSSFCLMLCPFSARARHYTPRVSFSWEPWRMKHQKAHGSLLPVACREMELLSYRARLRGNHSLSWTQLTYQILSRLISQTGTLAAQSILLTLTSKQGSDVARTTSSDEAFGSIETSNTMKALAGSVVSIFFHQALWSRRSRSEKTSVVQSEGYSWVQEAKSWYAPGQRKPHWWYARSTCGSMQMCCPSSSAGQHGDSETLGLMWQ